MVAAGNLWQQTRRLLLVIRLQPFTAATPEERSKERYRRIALTTLSNGLAQAISIVVTLVSVPLTIGYLGSERYGLWMTISSVIALLGFADLGMGNGLVNAVAEANGQDDVGAARRYVSSAFFILSGISALILGAFYVAYPLVSWPRVFNVKTAMAAHESGPAMAVLVTCFALQLPFSIVKRVQSGYQEGYHTGLWGSIGYLLGLAGVLVAVWRRAGLIWLVLAMSGGPALATVLNWLVQFGSQRRWLVPSLKAADWAAFRKVGSIGSMFLVLQLVATLASASDNFITAQVVGVTAVAAYAIVQKMFTFGPIIQSLVLGPLWPAYGEALARGDVYWVKKTLVRSLAVSLAVTGFFCLILVVLGQWIVKVWVGDKVTVAIPLLVGFALWTVLGTYGTAMSALLNGANALGMQMVSAILFGASSFGLKIYLARHWGSTGIIWATVVGYSVFSCFPAAIYVRRILRKREAVSMAHYNGGITSVS